jgi:hypothetical protein
MRKSVWCLFLTGAALFGQNASPDNAAADALRKRLLSMNLLNLPAPAPSPAPFVLAGVVMRPKICAIPLLNVMPPGTRDAMPTVKPAPAARGEMVVQVPAPACDATTFTNRK